MSTPLAVEIVEVGPRDGLQNESIHLPPRVRADLIRRLVDAGASRIEAVSFVRPDVVPQMAGAEEVMNLVPHTGDVSYIGLVLNEKGAQRAVRSGCGEINIVVAATDEFSLRNQNRTVEQMLEEAARAVEVAKESGVRTTITIAVAFGCPFTGPVSVDVVARVTEAALSIGIDEVAFADTIGVGVPAQVSKLHELVVGDERVDNVRFHFHNTRNTGYANAYAATQLVHPSRARVVLDASVGGFGGCPFAPAATGNIATEDLVYMLRNAHVRLVDGSGPIPRPAALEVTELAGIGAWLGEELDNLPSGLLLRAGDFQLGGAA